MYDSLPVIFLRELVEKPDGLQVLFESWWLEFRIGSARVVALEFGVEIHPAAEQSAADRAVCKYRYSLAIAVWQDVLSISRSKRL
jgi:hypothetical protein